jgi:L-seryl-tRNA(Ser) seleniumtransferase
MKRSSKEKPKALLSGLSRREFVGTALAGASAAACAQPEVGGDSTATGAPNPETLAADIEHRLESDNIYVRLLGLKPHLPAHGHATKLGGCRMPDEVIAAMQEANQYFVLIDELLVAAGKKAAEIVKAEDALITSGAAGGLLLGTAACLTGTDKEKMKALPHPTWPKHECVIQKANRYMYDHALRAAGATFVEVEGREQLVNAIGENTAMLFGIPRHGAMQRTQGADVVQPEEIIEIGKKAGVPVLIDGASRLPPASNLTQFNELGADLVVMSGGKGLEGPQSTGILSGRADLIEAARMQGAPFENIGRGMKVGKEEIIGLIVALERYTRKDHEAERLTSKRKADYIAGELQGISGLTAEPHTGDDELKPYVQLGWDEKVIPMSTTDVRETLKRRDSRRVAISSLYGGNRIQTVCMEDGEEVLVARYLRQFFTEVGQA